MGGKNLDARGCRLRKRSSVSQAWIRFRDEAMASLLCLASPFIPLRLWPCLYVLLEARELAHCIGRGNKICVTDIGKATEKLSGETTR
jgi:hypothetical protein